MEPKGTVEYYCTHFTRNEHIQIFAGEKIIYCLSPLPNCVVK